MKHALYITAFLLAAGSVHAQDDDPEQGLVAGHLIGDQSPQAAQLITPQLVHHDHKTPKVIGAIAAIGGGLALVGSFSLYVARQSYRQRPWASLSDNTINTWSSLGAWSLWMGVGASALLVTSEYLLLPESQDVPLLGWFAGGAGLVVAAVGLGFAVGGTKCPPQAIRPGADLLLACDSGTSDAVFGPLLLASAMPLVNVPLVWLLRSAFSGAPESLSVGPRGVSWTGRF